MYKCKKCNCRNGVITKEAATRLAKSRKLWVCDVCFEKGTDSPEIDSVLKQLEQLAEVLQNKKINQQENVKSLAKTMKILAATQSESLSSECQEIVHS